MTITSVHKFRQSHPPVFLNADYHKRTLMDSPGLPQAMPRHSPSGLPENGPSSENGPVLFSAGADGADGDAAHPQRPLARHAAGPDQPLDAMDWQGPAGAPAGGHSKHLNSLLSQISSATCGDAWPLRYSLSLRRSVSLNRPFLTLSHMLGGRSVD